MRRTYRLIVSCPDRVGIVAAVTNFIAIRNGWIVEASQHADPATEWFFMRYEILADSVESDIDGLRREFEPVAKQFSMGWEIADAAMQKRVVLMVSRQAHCLADLLYRWSSGELDCNLVAIISNHEELRKYAEWYGLPFHCVPVSREDKTEAFRQVDDLIKQYRADVVVLARYMQVLQPALCEKYAGRIINIHHSFLPSFAGARPYHQAHERGVKLIGATCHYVTEELDAGPIIEQDVIRVRHDNMPHDLVRLGRDVERNVLARGLRFHLEDRALIHGNKTVVFE